MLYGATCPGEGRSPRASESCLWDGVGVLAFGQVMHSWQVEQGLPWLLGGIMQDRLPPPRFTKGSRLALTYCDNFVTAANPKREADSVRSRVKARLAGHGFVVHEEVEAARWAGPWDSSSMG